MGPQQEKHFLRAFKIDPGLVIPKLAECIVLGLLTHETLWGDMLGNWAM
jgi:hypothetical protein